MKTFTFLWILSLFLCAHLVRGQEKSDLSLSKKLEAQYIDRSAKVNSFLQKNPTQKTRLLPNGEKAFLVDVDQNGTPYYYKLFNEQAGFTMAANHLYEGGELGLNLSGEGITVGVWDGGSLRSSHVEYQDRVKNVTGQALSAHAAHVMGTVLAGGIQERAKGIAYKASGKAFYGFENDLARMAEEAEKGMLLSNHSYGLIVGWQRDNNGNWVWYGADDETEDYRFGFYSSQSRSIDEIAYNNPYYTIVWAAGNDRSDVGDGSHQSDGQYDCLGPESVAKNNMVVGAIVGYNEYQGAETVEMSDFSSWGPTDDGRIKPDLVAKGVGVYSTGVDNDEHYYSSQGTSMAAPAVTGGLTLVQEHFHNTYGRYMYAATLKALAIHTVDEAGLYDGPDYQFGWGVLNVANAVKHINSENGKGNLIEELVLKDGESYEYEFISDGQTPITATIAWTDVPGTPTSPQLNPIDQMLINDLDIRIFDEENNEVFPWALERSRPNSAAFKADNTLDNVEKINFNDPLPRKYTIRVSHKGSLENGQQAFSLILSAGTNDDDNAANLYWIGGSGTWDNPTHWSLTSGGVSANSIPNENTTVIIDNNSLVADQENVIQVNKEDAQVRDFRILASKPFKLSLTNNIAIHKALFFISKSTEIENKGGRFILHSKEKEDIQIQLPINRSLPDLDLTFEGDGSWSINNEAFDIGTLELQKGYLTLSQKNISLKKFIHQQGNTALLQADSTNFFIKETFELGEDLAFEGKAVSINFNNENTTEIASLKLNMHQISHLILSNSKLNLGQDTYIEKLSLVENANLFFDENIKLQLSDSLVVKSDVETIALLKGVDGAEATLIGNKYLKQCFESLEVEAVNLEGEAVFNILDDSQIINSQGWSSGDCEDVLFADFDAYYLCEDGPVYVVDRSQGDVQTRTWNFGTETSMRSTQNLTDSTSYHIFDTQGKKQVQLTVSDASNTRSITKVLDIGANPLSDTDIINNETYLIVRLQGELYRWFRDGSEINGAQERRIDISESGEYAVLVASGDCAILASVPVSLVTASTQISTALFVYPNPFNEFLNIELPYESSVDRWEIYDVLGNPIMMDEVKQDLKILTISTDGISNGMYFIKLYADEGNYIHPIVKR